MRWHRICFIMLTPCAVASGLQPFTLRDFTGQTLEVRPVSYSAASNSMQVATSMRITVTLAAPDSFSEVHTEQPSFAVPPQVLVCPIALSFKCSISESHARDCGLRAACCQRLHSNVPASLRELSCRSTCSHGC